jgi:glutamine synthetase
MQDQSIQFLAKLSDRLQKDNRLEKLAQIMNDNYKYIPYFGVEVEFYLNEYVNVSKFENIIGFEVKRERGINQYEIALPPSNKLSLYANEISVLRNRIKNIALKLGGIADLSSKPFPNDYGNSIHFNLSFTSDTKVLEHAAKSLCHYMIDSFIIFMPEVDDYLRQDKRFMSPTHVCYGGNNRTAAIRIPQNLPLRLEHRVSSSYADPYLVMTAILKSVLLGLDNPTTISNFSKIYGNAYDEQYKLTLLPDSQSKAIELFNLNFFD